MVQPRRPHPIAERGCALSGNHPSGSRGAVLCARDRADLFRADLGPFHSGLCGAADRAFDLVDPIPDPFRPAPARGRGKPCGGGYGGGFRGGDALCGRADLRAALRLGGGLSGDRACRRLCKRHERRTRLYCAGCFDLCEMAALVCADGLPALRLS